MLCFYGKGGFTHDEVYNMPRYLRQFYLKQIEKINTERAEAQKASDNHSSGRSEIFSPPTVKQ